MNIDALAPGPATNTKPRDKLTPFRPVQVVSIEEDVVVFPSLNDSRRIATVFHQTVSMHSVSSQRSLLLSTQSQVPLTTITTTRKRYSSVVKKFHSSLQPQIA
jgi:hypothetical protein